jgi:hypothetical protein
MKKKFKQDVVGNKASDEVRCVFINCNSLIKLKLNILNIV